MQSKFKLRYLPIAEDDLVSIFDYIAQDSPERALAYVDKLDRIISILEEQPLLGRIPRHHKLREFGYRVLVVESYLVSYIVRNKVIEIHRFIHGSRNLDYII